MPKERVARYRGDHPFRLGTLRLVQDRFVFRDRDGKLLRRCTAAESFRVLAAMKTIVTRQRFNEATEIEKSEIVVTLLEREYDDGSPEDCIGLYLPEGRDSYDVIIEAGDLPEFAAAIAAATKAKSSLLARINGWINN